jgi:hypothetical protein
VQCETDALYLPRERWSQGRTKSHWGCLPVKRRSGCCLGVNEWMVLDAAAVGRGCQRRRAANRRLLQLGEL